MQRGRGACLIGPVDLVDGDRHRHGGRAQQVGDEPVAGAEALLGVDDQQAAVRIGELVLDPVLHPFGELVARTLDARQVNEDQLPVGPVGDAADRPPGRLGLVGDDRDLGADDRVGQRRLADVRPAGKGDEARAGCHFNGHRVSGSCRSQRPQG